MRSSATMSMRKPKDRVTRRIDQLLGRLWRISFRRLTQGFKVAMAYLESRLITRVLAFNQNKTLQLSKEFSCSQHVSLPVSLRFVALMNAYSPLEDINFLDNIHLSFRRKAITRPEVICGWLYQSIVHPFSLSIPCCPLVLSHTFSLAVIPGFKHR